MSLRALRTLLTISRKGSFVAASDQLGLTQAAVSLQMKNLEDYFETPLFNRDGNKPRLNASGRLAVERAEQILQLFDGLKSELNPSSEIRGELHLGAVHTVITGPLPAVLARIKKAHDQLRLKLACHLSAELAHRVEDEELDGALITEPIATIPSACMWTAYDTEYFYIAAPKDVPQMDEDRLFDQYPYIRFDRTAWAGTLIEAYLVERNIRLNEVMEFDTCEAALSLVAKGLGITVVPFSNKRLFEAGQHFTLIPFGKPQLRRRIGLYQKKTPPARAYPVSAAE